MAEPLSDEEKKSALQAYLAAEASLMADVTTSVEYINEVLKGVAGERAKGYKTYVSAEDLKNFFNFDDALVEQWKVYAGDILGRNELVDGMPKSSWLKSNKNNKTPTDLSGGGESDKGNEPQP